MSDFLFARPRMIYSIARIFDLGSTFNQYNASHSGKEADYIAIKIDWETVGQDICNAIQYYENSLKESNIKTPKNRYTKSENKLTDS